MDPLYTKGQNPNKKAESFRKITLLPFSMIYVFFTRIYKRL